jgi:hypothetical protein
MCGKKTHLQFVDVNLDEGDIWMLIAELVNNWRDSNARTCAKSKEQETPMSEKKVKTRLPLPQVIIKSYRTMWQRNLQAPVCTKREIDNVNRK